MRGSITVTLIGVNTLYDKDMLCKQLDP